jgi:hypothetical protein
MDIVNAILEAAGLLFILPSVLRARRLREVVGVHWTMPAFFWTWGVWNLFYYPHLDQGWSAAATIGVLAGNTAWLYCVLRYTRHVEPTIGGN